MKLIIGEPTGKSPIRNAFLIVIKAMSGNDYHHEDVVIGPYTELDDAVKAAEFCEVLMGSDLEDLLDDLDPCPGFSEYIGQDDWPMDATTDYELPCHCCEYYMYYYDGVGNEHSVSKG